MKAMVLAGIAILSLSGLLQAQVGAKADAISIPSFGGAKTVLRHCEAIEELSDAVKVRHDDGVWNVPLQFLPEQWQKSLQNCKDAAAAAEQKKLAEREEVSRLMDNTFASSVSTSTAVAPVKYEASAPAEASGTAASDTELAKREIVIVRIPHVAPPIVPARCPRQPAVFVIPGPRVAPSQGTSGGWWVYIPATGPSTTIKGVGFDDTLEFTPTGP